ncbi:META domain-containing protein [Flavobacterium pectinovorum]|uniref:META domain-containing protein n=1 Tax=Flavobacterium pectinovorum TaxID=29533 RepID=UPI001FAE5F5A|nr:META domain-containing protein [Flavobacterium pectinovorum]MCI9843209.1 META domain-containing protein [Flavobacterium pectinovorum]
MKKYLILLTTLSLAYNCKSVNTKDSNSSITTQYIPKEDITTYFKATGNEPAWEIKIGKEKIIFTSLIQGKENLSYPSVKPTRAMDANIKMYQTSNATSSITITIQQTDCQDSMADLISSYKVSVEIKNNSEADFEKLEGCGKYITDYRLHDIWVLEELNGYKVSITDFQKELPRIEIDAEENRFMGFGGCNSISGSLFFEDNLLRFSKVISTLMACSPGNKEDEFTKAIQSTTTYAIKNNRLTLSNPSGKLLVFKKVD